MAFCIRKKELRQDRDSSHNVYVVCYPECIAFPELCSWLSKKYALRCSQNQNVFFKNL